MFTYLISFTPGFSQVAPKAGLKGNRLNGFRVFAHISVTRLNPGVNKTKWRTFEAKPSAPVSLCLRAFVVNVSLSSERINYV
jgi:uncharacterized membrane protein